MKRSRKSSSRNGDIAEHYAITWLWDNGYEVFTNAGCTGIVDIVAMDKDGEMLKIDVKSDCWDETKQKYENKHGRSKIQKEQGVVLIGYHPVTRKLRFIKHRKL